MLSHLSNRAALFQKDNFTTFGKFLSIIFFCFSTVSLGQNKTIAFKSVIEKSFKESNLTIDSIPCALLNEKQLAFLIKKETWKVEDLQIFTCLFDVASKENTASYLGVLYYAAANAYAEFDYDERDSLLRLGYLSFEQAEDIEGKLFTQKKLFEAKSSFVLEKLDKNTHKQIQIEFNEIEALYLQSRYPPSILPYYASKLRKEIYLNSDSLDVDTLDNLLPLVEKFRYSHPKLAASLLNQMEGVSYFLKDFEKLLELNRKALTFANEAQSDYPSFLMNLGTAHAHLGDFDSAAYYYAKAYEKLPSEEVSTYSFVIKKTALKGLAEFARIKGNLEEAVAKLKESQLVSDKQLKFELEKKRSYAEEKFQLAKQALLIEKRDIQIKREQQARLFLITTLVFIVLLLLVFIHQYRKSRELQKRTLQLAQNREKLVQIIGHDLVAPLQSFATAADILPILIEQKKFQQLEIIQKSMSSTLVGLKEMLKNLTFWSIEMDRVTKDNTALQIKNISEVLYAVTAIYQQLAEDRNIHIQVQQENQLETKILESAYKTIVRNIVYNAVKHAPSNSSVVISQQRTSKNDLIFQCKNNVSDVKKNMVLLLTNQINKKQNLRAFSSGLGMDLIASCLQQLNAKLTATFENNQFELILVIPVTFNE